MEKARGLLWAAWGATAVSIAGQIVDQRWHAANPHFETAGDQLEAHWLVWLGEAALLVVFVLGVRLAPPLGHRYRLAAWIAVGLAAITIAHFVAHAMESDPDIIHVLLALAKVATLGAVILVSATTFKVARVVD